MHLIKNIKRVEVYETKNICFLHSLNSSPSHFLGVIIVNSFLVKSYHSEFIFTRVHVYAL